MAEWKVWDWVAGWLGGLRSVARNAAIASNSGPGALEFDFLSG